MKDSVKILILGDIHFPFHHKQALKRVVSIAKEMKPTHIVQIGDLYDQYSFSKYVKRTNINYEEMEKARELAEKMWAELVATKAECTQILGNHDIRLIKRIQEKLPEAQELVRKSLMEYYQFPGVRTIPDDRVITLINGVSFHHGYLSKLGDHMRTHGKSMVVGHSHVGGVVFEQRGDTTMFELNAGYLADETAEPLRYKPTTSSKWTLGYAVIDEQGPRFVSL